MGTDEIKTGANTPNVSNSTPQNVADGTGDNKLSENAKDRLDQKQDEGLEETFPGSDPVSVKITK